MILYIIYYSLIDITLYKSIFTLTLKLHVLHYTNYIDHDSISKSNEREKKEVTTFYRHYIKSSIKLIVLDFFMQSWTLFTPLNHTCSLIVSHFGYEYSSI